MRQALSSYWRAWRMLLLAHPYWFVAGAALIGLVILLCVQVPKDWENVYVPAAARLARGEDIFQDGFVYPPINAWVALPFAGLSRPTCRILWFAVNAAALMILIRGAWRLSGGGRLDGSPPVAQHEHVIFALGLLCGIYYVLDALTVQQTDLIVAAIVILGCLALAGRRDWSAALLLGLAAGIKCTPLLWTGYLLWRRRWRAAVVVPLVAVSINLIPDLTHPADASRFQEWGQRFLLPMTDRNHDAGSWVCGVGSNHSLSGLSYRILAWESAGGQPRLSDSRFSPQVLRAVGVGSAMLFVVAALVSTWTRSASLPDDLGTTDMAWEFSLVLILMALLSPASSKPHFCTLLLPGFCVARAAVVGRPNRFRWTILVAAIACGLVSNKDLVGRRVYDWALWHGSVTFNAIFLFAGCCQALLLRRRAQVAVTESSSPDTYASRQAA